MALSAINNEDLPMFYALCRTAAQAFYRREISDPYPYLRMMKEGVSFRRISGTAFADDLMRLSDAQRGALVRSVKALGFNQIGHLANGGSAGVFLVRNTSRDVRDKVFALRVPFRQAHGEGGPDDPRHTRPDHPLFLQPLVSLTQGCNGVAAEILPYVPVLGQCGGFRHSPSGDDSPLSRNSECIKVVAECAGINLDRVDGVGLLPNGTFVLVDPDQGSVATEDPINAVQKFQRGSDVPFQWVMETGGLAQKEFWPAEKLFPAVAA